ncbi:GntR family transcriptional regulator [Bosea sp. BH3]|uniref:GntR family transcriptional regulator n=1 Tax=Bosea sp. BH3 TaxID=2871701 RepID=UPI0021CB802C|nr:GntR family transcriptional regulator [Bosea sp. BH3]MCU4180409.1 GntR family transcriptional regulator [Bosea sp. BH3]
MARSSSQSRHRLANQILDLIRNARFEPGHHLREQALGDLLGVSRSPIRSALQLLCELGVVEARRNHGFFLLKPFDALQRLELEVPSSADRDLYDQLVGDRLRGHLPASLTQSEIAQRYSVDRVVLMRTLARLAEDGLIARNKGHGWTFLPMLDSRRAMASSYDFRRVIEPALFLVPTFKADPTALSRARAHHLYFLSHPDLSTVDATALFDTDASFHEMFAEFSGNAFFLQAIQQQNRLRRLLEFNSYGNLRRVRDWLREHVAIIDTVLAGDLERSSTMMREHLTAAFGKADSTAISD